MFISIVWMSDIWWTDGVIGGNEWLVLLRWKSRKTAQNRLKESEMKCYHGNKNTENEIKVKKSHHIGTEPLLNVIHDRGLRHGDLWSKATDKPKRPKATKNKNTPPTNKNTNNKITEKKITTTEKCNSCHTKPTHTHTHTHCLHIELLHMLWIMKGRWMRDAVWSVLEEKSVVMITACVLHTITDGWHKGSPYRPYRVWEFSKQPFTAKFNYFSISESE